MAAVIKFLVNTSVTPDVRRYYFYIANIRIATSLLQILQVFFTWGSTIGGLELDPPKRVC